MHTSTMFVVLILCIACFLCAATSLIISSWQNGGLERRVRITKRNVKKIARQIHNDISVALHH